MSSLIDNLHSLANSAVPEMTALSDAILNHIEIAGDFPARRLVAGRRVAWLASEGIEWMRCGCEFARGRSTNHLIDRAGIGRKTTPQWLPRCPGKQHKRCGVSSDNNSARDEQWPFLSPEHAKLLHDSGTRADIVRERRAPH
jgi:hypothetical protein